MVTFTDFDLRVQADGDRFVTSARYGDQTAREPFELDLSASWGLWRIEAGGRRQIRESGAALFDALMRGGVRDLYQQARGGIGDAAKRGLRIRILLDPRDSRLRPLIRLPWEILFDPSADIGGQPALDPRRPVVRVIDTREPTPAPPPGPLRQVLLAMASSAGWTALDLPGERNTIERALARLYVRVHALERTTRSALLDRIRDVDHEIFHFMGHGRLDPATQEGVLVLEREDGTEDLLPASVLAGSFALRMPRLVVLAACQSGEAGSDPACGPFASVAAALVAAGLPAVVAMQTSVDDRSAIRFTERLYLRLSEGDPVEAAVADARVALHADHPELLDWAVPVLFVRGQPATHVQPLVAETAQPAGAPAGHAPSPSALVTFNQRDVGIQIVGNQIGNLSVDEKARRG